jgi:hypothetical protein
MFISRIVSPNPKKSPIFLTGNAMGESRDWEIEVRCWPIGWQRKAHWYCQYKSPDLEYWEKEIPKSQSRLCCCCVRCAMLWLRWAHTSETAGFSLCIARGQQMGINSIGFGYTYNIGWSTESELLGDDSWLTCSRALFSIWCIFYFILFYFIPEHLRAAVAVHGPFLFGRQIQYIRGIFFPQQPAHVCVEPCRVYILLCCSLHV